MDTTVGIVVANGRVLTPSQMIQRGAVWIRGERIVGVGERVPDESGDATVIDASDLLVVPGLIDIHVHGGAGFDTMDATPEAIGGMAQFFARHGVTSFLATTMTAGREETLAAIANAARCQHTGTGGAHVLGVHLEGPYISREQPGAQPVAQIRPADPAEY
ncbi:MAG TPA: amidohydrolase family protein, partial [Herpetosiphonaceae bacterium]|nr:amidohydrolase family protein [Herpetosiphonaceae bacterium]